MEHEINSNYSTQFNTTDMKIDRLHEALNIVNNNVNQLNNFNVNIINTFNTINYKLDDMNNKINDLNLKVNHLFDYVLNT